MRIVSLIASATEIAAALGLEDCLVGRSHECDYPPGVGRLPVCTAPRFAVDGSSRDIDDGVKALLRENSSIYTVDAELLRRLRPDLILTQAQCEVCAVSERDVLQALQGWPNRPPAVVTLLPNDLADVRADIRKVAAAAGCVARGEALLAAWDERTEAIRAEVGAAGTKPRVACLEWLDPLMAAGNWVPELVEQAGGINLFGEAGRHSPGMSWEELAAADPDVIVAMPCGFDLERTAGEMAVLDRHPVWPTLRAVREGRVYATDGNQYFNRPGPRLAESLEILAEILHPEKQRFGHEGAGWRRCRGAGIERQ